MAAYSKGEVLLAQLGYVIGNEVRDRALKNYFELWKFKHPTSSDFKRVMERESGIELDWYFEYFENSTHTIDYSNDKGDPSRWQQVHVHHPDGHHARTQSATR